MAASVRTLQRLARRSLPSPFATRRLAFSTTACARTIENPREQYRAFQRQGEADETLRRRLIYQSRYRGTLESDLLMSTFAADHLPTMNRAQLEEYDQFLLEEDWDIYYWATQDPKDPASLASRGEGAASPSSSSSDPSTPAAQPAATEDSYKREPVPGEWARIAGNFEAGYRPVPERWRDTELLRKLRQHVLDKSAAADGKGGGGGGMSARPLLFGKGTEKD